MRCMNATNGRVNILPCPNATRAIVDHRSLDAPSILMSRPKSMLRFTNEKRLKAKKLAVASNRMKRSCAIIFIRYRSTDDACVLCVYHVFASRKEWSVGHQRVDFLAHFI